MNEFHIIVLRTEYTDTQLKHSPSISIKKQKKKVTVDWHLVSKDSKNKDGPGWTLKKWNDTMMDTLNLSCNRTTGIITLWF